MIASFEFGSLFHPFGDEQNIGIGDENCKFSFEKHLIPRFNCSCKMVALTISMSVVKGKNERE